MASRGVGAIRTNASRRHGRRSAKIGAERSGISCNGWQSLATSEGKNLVFEFIQVTNTNIEDYARGNRELVSRGVDILIAIGTEIALKTALAATDRLPIVMLAIDYDPIALGYVTSLARPTGSVTGIFFRQIELTTKRLQIVKDVFPELRAATAFWDRISADQFQATQGAAKDTRHPAFRKRAARASPTITTRRWRKHRPNIMAGCS